jgi:hypothetical protein
MIVRISLIAVLGSASLAAQVEGPKLGFVYDRQAAAVRPILGIPGAALFGDTLATDLKDAVVSPSQNFAIGVTGDDAAVSIYSIREGTTRLLKGAYAAPDRIVLSPNGSAAAIRKGSHVQVFAGLPSDASPLTEFDVADAPGALAVSDDGSIVLAAASESGGAALYSYDASGTSRRLLTATHIGSVEFLNGSHDAVFADSAENKVFLLRDASDVSLLADIDQPTALAASRDNRKIFVASSASRSLTTISLADGTSVSTACLCTPITLARLQGGDVFRVTDIGDGPSWLFDTSGAEPRVVFIPQLESSNE